MIDKLNEGVTKILNGESLSYIFYLETGHVPLNSSGEPAFDVDLDKIKVQWSTNDELFYLTYEKDIKEIDMDLPAFLNGIVDKGNAVNITILSPYKVGNRSPF